MRARESEFRELIELATAEGDRCASEAVHTPGAIRPEGALIAYREDGMVAAVSENIGDFCAGLSADDLIGCEAPGWLLDQVSRWPVERLPAWDEPPVIENPANNLGPSPATLGLALHRSPDGSGIAEVFECEADDLAAIPLFDRAILESTWLQADPVEEEALLGSLVAGLREATGFERSLGLVFRTDDESGEVVAESCVEGTPSLLGLRYPAKDIPRQARALYRRHPVRWVADTGYGPVPLRTVSPADDLDLSGSLFRSVSSTHRQYMRNLGLGASLSLSVVCDGRLWGMLLLHSSKPRRVPPVWIRNLWSLSRALSARVTTERQRKVSLGRLRAFEVAELERRMIERVESGGGFGPVLLESAESLLDLIPADGVAVGHGDRSRCLGITPRTEICATIAERLGDCEGVAGRENIGRAVPEHAAELGRVAGALSIRFGGEDGGWVTWYRVETPRIEIWAGDPEHQSDQVESAAESRAVTARSDFTPHRRTIEGLCREWSEPDLALAAALLRSLDLVVVRLSKLTDEVERRRASEQRLEAVIEDLQTFAYAASHDLREPLRGISMTAELLVRRLATGDTEGASRYAERTQRIVHRMRDLIEGMSRLSKATTRSLELEPVNLNGLVDRIVEERPGTASLVSRGELPTLTADRAMLTGLISNLIDNAIKYAQPEHKPRVRIESQRSAATRDWIIKVIDNGRGIPEEMIEKVFNAFERGATGTEIEGSGLGLALCRRIAERHGASIGIESQVDSGTVVTLTWPAVFARPMC